MDPQRPTRAKKKDRTGVFISTVLHVLIIAVLAYFVSKTKFGQEILQKTLGTTRDKKVEDKPKPPPEQRRARDTLKPPPGAPPPSRRQAADAPAAVGESFFGEDRSKAKADADAAARAAGPKVVALPPPPPPPPKPAMKAAGSTSIRQLYAERAKEAAVVEAIGSEQISKSGGSDAGDVVGKISGATIVDGKFAVIRGLSDRYVSTTLNGAEVPSPDPYRRAASLDMFPAQVISKVAVSKTFTPDQQGSFTGGGIDIVTKSFPEKSFVSFSIGAGYNTQATGDPDYLTYSGGGRDWTGMDDGTRSLPAELDRKDFNIPPAPVNTGRRGNPDFEKNLANAEIVKRVTELMGHKQFEPETDAPPVNHNFSLAAGETTYFLGKPLGVFAGVNYKREYNFYEEAPQRRYQPNTTHDGVEVKSDFSDTRSTTEVNWAAMASLAYQLHEHHQLGFNFLRNQNSEDISRTQVGKTKADPDPIWVMHRLHWTERTLETFQLKGGHVFPGLGNLRFDWLGVLSGTSQDEPDVAFFHYPSTGDLGRPSTPEPRNPTRFFRNLEEDNRNIKLDLTLPFWQWTMNEGAMKVGYWDSDSERDYVDREIYYVDGFAPNNPPFSNDPNNFLNSTNLGYNPTTNARTGNIIFNWRRYAQGRESVYFGDYRVRAGYWMLDTPIIPTVRLIGGVRVETTDIQISSRSYQASSVTGLLTNNTELSEAHLLPAVSVVWGMTSNMNVRASFSQTLARPSFRELAAVRSYDPGLDEILEGNPLLRMIDSDNYDVRWEWFFRPGELLSAGLFYKTVKNAIEKKFVTQDMDIVTFDNRDKATVMGVEFEARKNLGFLGSAFDYFSVGGNLALIKSEVELTEEELENKQESDPDADDTRPMYDQAPYILNLDLSYDNLRSGTSASLVFNVAGPRVVIASPKTDDVYEQPAHSLDFIFSQRLGKHLAIKFAVKNILNPEFERTIGEDGKDRPAGNITENGTIPDSIYSSYRKGLTFSVGLSYDF